MKHNTVQPFNRKCFQQTNDMPALGKTSEVFSIQLSKQNIHNQRWEAHRKRLGIVNRNKTTSHDIQYIDELKANLIHFIQSNFKRKECSKFVPKIKTNEKEKGNVKCQCGALPEEHYDKNIATEFYRLGASRVEEMVQRGEIDSHWSKEQHIKKYQTNAFGKIDFQYEGLGGRKPAKYIRLADDTPVDLVLDLLKNHWHMDYPRKANLVITVIGGAKNFRLDGRRKEVFNRGLVNAAQTTNAWIITSGFNMGVMRAVGEAVAEAQSYTYDKNGMTHTLRCIGIAPWGYVLDNKSLINKNEEGSWNASYKPSKVIEHGSPVSLNPHHTHFLLVDDGCRGHYGGVAEFRARLESKLAAPFDPRQGNDARSGIPVVLVVVEGGYDAIMDVSRSIEARIPCVICEGTGRAADILAYASLHFVTTRDQKRVMKEKHRLILEDKLISAYGKTWSERSNMKKEAAKYLETVLKCCEDDKLITVFDMNKNEELDVAILSALLKGKGATNLDQLHDQLRLALTWNRTDIARDDIFTLNVTWPTGSLNDIMTDALIDNKTGFVRLLLQNGFIMDEYLTAPTLRMLYNKAPKSHHLKELLQSKTANKVFTLKAIGKLLQDLLDKYDYSEYKQDTAHIKDIENKLDVRIPNGSGKLENPYKDLFLWAVLLNRQDLAKFFWEHGHEAIPSALAACKIFDSMIKKLAHYDTDLRSTYMKNKYEFECLAIKVLDECNNIDPEKAALLIERKYPSWGNMDCLEIAALADNKEFLSTVCCQNSLTLMWKRGIASHSALVPICLLFPPLIFCVIKFQGLGQDDETLSTHQKLITFYQAPVTKFTGHLMMYMIFLIVYSYMLLFGYKEQVTPVEWLVIAWLSTMIIEGIRQMFFNSLADSFKQRLNLWWNFSAFNRLDALMTVLVILTLILRFMSGVPVIYAKNVYGIMCIFLFIRVLREYTASSFLGPKLVMINQMLKELILFMMILLVFLLAYGISSQALMHPYRDFTPMIFRDILYYPYWQVYGELYLDELEGRTDDCRNSTVNADGYPCPRFSWLVIIFTACYLLVGNLLLLNILIAIFNNVFNEIQTNSIQVWKYGMYYLVVDYDNKPTLAPPFIIFEHIYQTLKWICRVTCCKQQKHDNSAELKCNIMTLKLFEKECVKETIRKEQISEQEFLPKKLAYISNRVDEMAKILEEEHLLEQQHFEAEQNKLESQLSSSLSENELDKLSESRSFSDLGSLSQSGSSSPLISFSQAKPFSRWPTLSVIKGLKSKMERIEEVDTPNEPVAVSRSRQTDHELHFKFPDQNENVDNPVTLSHIQEQQAPARSKHGRSGKLSQRREKKHWNRGYEELIDDVGMKNGQTGAIRYSLREGGNASMTLSRQIQKNKEELEGKLEGLNARLSGLEENIEDISRLLKMAISQRKVSQSEQPSVQQRRSFVQDLSVSHDQPMLVSVPRTELPSDAYGSMEEMDRRMQPQQIHQRTLSDDYPILQPVSLGHNYSTLLQVNTSDVPLTHPPSNPFGHFDSSS